MGGGTSRRRRVASGALVAVLSTAVLLLGVATSQAATPAPGPTTTAPAPAAKRTCDQYGSFPVGGAKYVVQNNRWGAATQQCITAFDTGFSVDVAAHTNRTGPAAYPSIYRGCVHGYCTYASPFPRKVTDLGALRSTWSTSGPTGGGTQQYNTSYDVWFDPSGATTTGRNTGAEMMIWLNRTSWVQPIGKKYTEVSIAGTTWEVWYGTIDLPVISFVRKAPVTSVADLPIEAFAAQAVSYGVVKPAWYLTSVQAGFEPWTGGTGLRTNSFSLTRNGA